MKLKNDDLVLNIVETDTQAIIEVVNQRYFGTDFNNGYFYFQASNGFRFHSTHTELKIGMRQPCLYVSSVDNNDKTKVCIPYTCGQNRSYVKYLKQALEEYNGRNRKIT